MGFVRKHKDDLVNIALLGGTGGAAVSAAGTNVGDIAGGLTGETAADAAIEAARIQQEGVSEGIAATEAAREQGLGFLEPFSGVGQSAIEQQGFLTDPQAQFDFLQNNPLFQASLEQAGTETKNLAAARGRLSAGDTLQQLSKNVLLSASPLIQQQKGSIMDLLNLGTNVAGSQANIATGAGANIADLITSGSAVEAAGVTGAANAQAQGSQNILQTALLAGAVFSDRRLKSNLNKITEINGYSIYSWTWNKLAESLGLVGTGQGVIAQYVFETNPEAITIENGYMKVNYSMLGIPHGG
jgi:hypothetical protein